MSGERYSRMHEQVPLTAGRLPLTAYRQQVEDRLVELMQSVAKLDVPLIVEVGVGENWDKVH